MSEILDCLKESQFFSIHTDEITDVSVQQQCGIMLRFFDNTDGRVRCVFFPSLFPDSVIAKSLKCGRTKPTAVVKLVAQEMSEILDCLKESQFFSIHTDEITDVSVQQQCGIMLRFFDNTDGRVRCVFFKLEPVQTADAEGLFFKFWIAILVQQAL